jgi:3-isopropylmalate/(R)-2-methylmalate dehydratase large subunit
MTIVCGDSHTSTHGAFGALAFGIGTTEVGHVLATQCLLQQPSKTFAITIDGPLGPGVSAKDLVLHTIATVGVDGGTGHVVEFRGSTIRGLSMEERMTVCNMSIELGARAGLIAPDAVTFDWLRGRTRAPAGADWDAAVAAWSALASDPDAAFDREIRIDARHVRPTVTVGTDPGSAMAIDGIVPQPRGAAGQRALDYMRFAAGKSVQGEAVDVAAACIRGCGCWWCRARSRCDAPPRPRACTRCSVPPAPSGASPAARCASR